MGIESGAATGWPATDWIEDDLLAQAGPDDYDKWVNHEIPFNDPAVKKAAQEFAKLVLADGNVLGGRKAIVSTNFATVGEPDVRQPARSASCTSRATSSPRPASSRRRSSPTSTTRSASSSYPGQTADSKPMLGGGDLAAVFNGKDDDTKTGDGVPDRKGLPRLERARRGFLSPHKDYDADQLQVQADPADRAARAAVAPSSGSTAPTRCRARSGSGSFWKGMIAWVSGQKDLDTTLKRHRRAAGRADVPARAEAH